MKRTILRTSLIVFGCAVFCAALMINLSAINGHSTSLISRAMADDEAPDGGGCCKWYYPSGCIQRVQSIPIVCGGQVIESIKYYAESSKVTLVGTATYNETTGQLTITSGTMSGYTTITKTTVGGYNATKVNCPTDGNCNTCVEYSNPCNT